MKECTKCRRLLDESCFVKSDRYLCGLYPSCKECRKATRLKTHAANPNCARCRVKPHLPNRAYCYECDRIKKNRAVVPKFRRDPSNKEYCSKCKQLPKLPYHAYCQMCQRDSRNNWQQKKRGLKVPNDIRRKKSARHYINTLLRRKKIKRKPCEVCGAPSQHFHHLDYKNRTTNVQHLCFKCHVEAERQKRRLTKLNHSVSSVVLPN